LVWFGLVWFGLVWFGGLFLEREFSCPLGDGDPPDPFVLVDAYDFKGKAAVPRDALGPSSPLSHE
jgi:hypothetical protein